MGNYNHFSEENSSMMNSSVNDKSNLLAKGGSAEAYLEYDQAHRGLVVAKRFFPESIAEFTAEKDILKRLKHQNIIAFVRADEANGPTLVTEYAKGGSLVELIYGEKTKRFLEEDQVKRIFKDIVNAVAYLHSNDFAHRDLKPGNVVLSADGTAKLIDFGHACELSHAEETGEEVPRTTGCGTTCYMAPELFTKQAYIATKADIYSLGVLLFELVAGKRPFERPSEDDEVFELVKEQKFDQFWSNFELPLWADEEVKSLITSMIDFFPDFRPTAEEVLNNSWLCREQAINKFEDESHWQFLPTPGIDRDLIVSFTTPVKPYYGSTVMSTYDSGEEDLLEESTLRSSSKAIRKFETGRPRPFAYNDN
eukprot:TRINITY_DN1732_c0_g1_i3.p1 TRINITY_DN1732_c0_g1~~TRINITY_DN1732_c0_g1_i3.p1  ORF type:complete len:366 (+),score=102.98 TRINITY_DN1732_c0_g1_i3:89-1186(+)